MVNWRIVYLSLLIGFQSMGAEEATYIGKGYGIQMLRDSPQIIDSYPGEIHGARFFFTNTSNDTDFFLKVDHPGGWNIISPLPFPLTFEKNQIVEHVTTFVVPKDAVPGLYTINLLVYGVEDPAVTDHEMFQVQVIPWPKDCPPEPKAPKKKCPKKCHSERAVSN